MPQGLVHEAIEVLMQNRKTIRGPKGDDCALITVIGSGFWQSPETLEKVHRVIANPKLLDVKNNALTVAVANEQLETVLQGLHDVLIG
jgi:aspartokinase